MEKKKKSKMILVKGRRPKVKESEIQATAEEYVKNFKPETDDIEKWKRVLEDLEKIEPYHPGFDHIRGHPGVDSQHQVKRYAKAIGILWVASQTKEIKQASEMVLQRIMQNAEKLSEYERNWLQYRLRTNGVCIDVIPNTSHDPGTLPESHQCTVVYPQTSEVKPDQSPEYPSN